MLIPLLLAAVQPQGMDPAVVAVARDWTICLTGSAERLTVAGAEPRAVADAAVAGCRAQENAVVAAHVAIQGPASADAARAGFQRSARSFVENRTRTRLEAIGRSPIDGANHAHGACVGERVGLDAASTSRPAAAIIDEAFAACRLQEQRLHAAIAAVRGRAAADREIAAIVRSARESSAVLVAETRRAPAEGAR